MFVLAVIVATLPPAVVQPGGASAIGVLIDFTGPPKASVDLVVEVELRGATTHSYTIDHPSYDPRDGAQLTFGQFSRRVGFVVEQVSPTKVRFIGCEKDGKFYPAVRGKVTSKTIPTEQLPKVTNPPEA